MATQQIGQTTEFKFPHESGKDVLESKSDLEIEIEPSSATSPFEKPEKKEEVEAKAPPKKDDDVEIEVVDDTPKADQGRQPSPPPAEVTDEELDEYSEKVQKRLKHFSKGYHDERREKEKAQREAQEAISYAQRIREENERLKNYGNQSQQAMMEQAEKTLEQQLAAAERDFCESHEAGNTDEFLKAQKKLNKVQGQMDRLAAIKARGVQTPQPVVQERNESSEQQSSFTQPRQVVDERADKWREDNTWFGSDEEMTSLALGYHQKLLRQGVDPTSDEYYEKVNSRMREVFPAYFRGLDGDASGDATPPASAQSTREMNVVAPATRTRGPKKVRLTETQVRFAKRMGVPLEEYAKQVAIQERAERNG